MEERKWLTREIIFRGRTANDDNKWIYGGLVESQKKYWIHIPGAEGELDTEVCVDPDTIGQYIGSVDINRQYIYEGDRVRMHIDPKYSSKEIHSLHGCIGEVIWESATSQFAIYFEKERKEIYFNQVDSGGELEVINE